MFEFMKGKADAKRNMLSVDSATGLKMSPYAFGLIDKVRKKREKLAKRVQNKKDQAMADKLSECLSSIILFNDPRTEKGGDTIEEKFNSFYIDTQKSSVISLYKSLKDSQALIAGPYLKTLRRVEKRLFRYFSGVGLYMDIDVRRNSEIARLAPSLARPPVMPGLEKLYEHIPANIRETLPSVSDVD